MSADRPDTRPGRRISFRDIRRSEATASPGQGGGNRSTKFGAEGEDHTARVLDRICRQLVERATGGALTLEGDRVVTRGHLRRESTNAADDTLIGMA